MTRPVLLFSLALLFAAPGWPDDVVVFVNGDRLSGTVVARGTKRIKLRTPYGRLDIPRTEIERLIGEDGREEIVTPPAGPPPPKTTSDLALLISGHTFWQAWDPVAPPADPSLRLVLRLDGNEVSAWADVNLDPDDLPEAIVNSFLFDPERLLVRSAEGVVVAAPEPTSRSIRLALELPAELAGERSLQVAYQVNDGSPSDPEWRDVVQSEIGVDLAPEAPVRVKLAQDRGMMEYTERAMRSVESFRAIPWVLAPLP